MIEILGLAGSPVGVPLIPPSAAAPAGVTALKHQRYCQAVMKVRRGASVVLAARARRVGLLRLFPLDRADDLSGVVVLEDEIEKLM